MAAGGIPKKTRAGKTADERKKQLELNIARAEAKVTQKESDEKVQQAEEEIARLRKQLELSDEKLMALADADLGDPMEIEGTEGQDTDGQGKGAQGENAQDENAQGTDGEEAVKIKKEPDETGGKGGILKSVEGKGIKSDEKPLFVLGDEHLRSNAQRPSLPVIDGETALYSRPGPAPGSDGKTVGWVTRFSKQKLYINMYGPKNSARYRLEPYADSELYDDPPEKDFSNADNRHGDEKSGKAFKYTKRHIKGIFGVAWKHDTEIPEVENLDLIDPEQVKSWRHMPTYILIAWQVGDVIKKTWEPRQALRARWGTKAADEAIYKAAEEAESRFAMAQTGERIAKSRSPSSGLADLLVRNQREKSLATDRSAGSQIPSADQEMLQKLLGQLSIVDILQHLPPQEKLKVAAALQNNSAILAAA
jgi:hypothetical protein